MPRITLRLTDKQHQFIQAQAKAKRLPLSRYLKHLIEFGLNIEQASQANPQKTEAYQDYFHQLQLKVFQGMVEALYLTRHIALQVSPDDVETKKARQLTSSKKAQEFIDSYLGGFYEE